MKANFKKNQGLTLIELLVAIGILNIVVSIVFGVLVLAVVQQRRIIALRNVEDNIRFAGESMAREIRTGKDFSYAGAALAFTNADGELIIYRLNEGVIEKSSDGGTNYLPVSGSDTVMNYLNFFLLGENSGDGLQPRITVAMGATSQVGNQSVNLKVQTSINSRLLQD